MKLFSDSLDDVFNGNALAIACLVFGFILGLCLNSIIGIPGYHSEWNNAEICLYVVQDGCPPTKR